MPQIAISVIMPVYNMEAYIAAAIDSILRQTFSDFEFIIVDDGSVDSSLDIVKSYFFDSRISIINLPQQSGNYPARNMGIFQAQGKYICVMDADDIASCDRLRVEYEYMECHPEVLAAGSHYSMMGTDYKPIKPQGYHSIREVLLSHNCFLHSSLIIRTDVLKAIEGYDESFIYSADYDLMCRLALRGVVVNLPDNLMSYRLHAQQISNAHSIEQMKYAHQIRCKYQMTLINRLLENTNLRPVTMNEVAYSEMGQAIFCFVYAKVNHRQDYEERGERLLETVYEKLYKLDAKYKKELFSVKCGIIYLLRNGLAEGDEDEILADIDQILAKDQVLSK